MKPLTKNKVEAAENEEDEEAVGAET